MTYILFILLFVIAHVISYTVAGAITLKFSKDIYETKNRLCHFLNDMANENERKHVEKYFLPAQLARGLLMSIVLFPIFDTLINLNIFLLFIFFASLMFVYTHLSSASPFMDNIEGHVYFKKNFLQKKSFIKFQIEMILYSLLFAVLMTTGMSFII